MKAFIKDDKLIVNSQILSDEKRELKKFIDKAETHTVSATTLYNIEGDKAGIEFGTDKDFEQLNITPITESQSFEGIYNKVDVEAINTEEAAPVLDFSDSNYMEIIPEEGNYFNKVTIEKDEDLIPANIKTGVTVDGIEGTFTADADALAEDIVTGKTAYVNGQEVVGTYEGIIPEGNLDITENGVYDIKNYASVDVDVQTPSEYNGKFITTNRSGQYNTIQRYIKEVPALDITGYTSCSSFFSNCDSLEKVTLFDTSNVTNMKSMFQDCTQIIEIPQFDTSNVTDMMYMFSGCERLTTIPILDVHLVAPYYMGNMYANCAYLTNESLNNILYMLAHCGSGAAYRTLQHIGLSQEQATKCTTLSNWNACTAKGWTTGY